MAADRQEGFAAQRVAERTNGEHTAGERMAVGCSAEGRTHACVGD